MDATLRLYGDIGESLPETFMGEGAQSFSAKNISDFLDENTNATNITIRINSRGGDVQEGWAIHDLLVNSGKHIKTIGEGKVYSIATIVFLAGSEREMMKNADGLIHNPYIPPFTLADQYESDDLIKIAEGLKQEEAKILDFYAERTGTDKAKLAEYMANDTKLSAEDMLTLGFATKIIEPVMAFAYYKPIKIKMNETDVKTFGQKLDQIWEHIKGFSRIPPKDQVITDKDGKEFKIEKESGAPVVGDKATPDGSFTMTDGKVIVISNGVITEIKEAPVGKSELEIANERIVELTAELEAAKKEKIDSAAAAAELENEKVKVSALYGELSNLKNTWKPEGRTKFSSTEKVGSINLNKVREMDEKVSNLKNK
jgi:ATP-dependent protease ClpP protease subunit